MAKSDDVQCGLCDGDDEYTMTAVISNQNQQNVIQKHVLLKLDQLPLPCDYITRFLSTYFLITSKNLLKPNNTKYVTNWLVNSKHTCGPLGGLHKETSIMSKPLLIRLKPHATTFFRAGGLSCNPTCSHAIRFHNLIFYSISFVLLCELPGVYNVYSYTWIQRPPLGDTKSGLLIQGCVCVKGLLIQV